MVRLLPGDSISPERADRPPKGMAFQQVTERELCPPVPTWILSVSLDWHVKIGGKDPMSALNAKSLKKTKTIQVQRKQEKQTIEEAVNSLLWT